MENLFMLGISRVPNFGEKKSFEMRDDKCLFTPTKQV